jgi:methylase of polypeptide subunit release factors
MKGTKLSFMRDILSETKQHLKQNEVIRLEIPQYQEISVKNLYDDAMRDPALAKYLPSKEQLSNTLPEREDFFFGVLCTLKMQYMQDIIAGANSKRFKASEDD